MSKIVSEMVVAFFSWRRFSAQLVVLSAAEMQQTQRSERFSAQEPHSISFLST
jgi:hypothetical protein